MKEDPLKLVKAFNFSYDRNGELIIKSQATINKEIKPHSKYLDLESHLTFLLKDGVKKEIKKIETYEKDTTITVLGKQIKGIFYKTNKETKFSLINDPDITKLQKTSGYKIYGQHLGLVNLGSSSDNELVEYKLIKIE